MGETIKITFKGAPKNSYLTVTRRVEWYRPKAKWGVHGSGVKEYTIKKEDRTGRWGVTLWRLRGGCISRKYFTVAFCRIGKHEVLTRCWDEPEKQWREEQCRDCVNGVWIYSKKDCAVPEEAKVVLTDTELAPTSVWLWGQDFDLRMRVKNIGKTFTHYGIKILFDDKVSDYKIRADGANGLLWTNKKEWMLHFNYPDMLGLKLGKHVLKIVVETLGRDPKVFDTREIPFEVTNDWGTGEHQITFTAKPEIIMVYVNADRIKNTPCRANLDEGRYTITCGTHGYHAQEFAIDVGEGHPKEHFIELVEKPEPEKT